MSANLLWRKDDTVTNFALPCYPNGETNGVTYNCNNGAGLKIYTKTSVDDYLNYCTTLKTEGWTEQSARMVENNFFTTFMKDTNLLHIYYCDCFETTRIITEPNAKFFSKMPQPYKKSCSASLTQLSLDQTVINCGMSYVMKTDDNSFFIIDGGYFNPMECHNLFDTLQSLAGDEEIIISGWFFSHIHQDHVGCFMDFVKNYLSKVRIQAFYYNFPSIERNESIWWSPQDSVIRSEFYEIMENYCADIPHYKLHTGDVFTVRNLELEVLYTHEDLYPKTLSDFNDSSTILLLSVEGQKILWLGDIHNEASDILEKMYHNHLKSDMVQVAHHGFDGAKKIIYILAKPWVVLWPCPDYCFEGDLRREENHYLAYECGAEHFISGFGTASLPLPYVAKMAKDNSDRIPNEE